MTGNEQEEPAAGAAAETVAGAPEWGGVPVGGGDNADATGGPPMEVEPDPTPAEAGDDAPADSAGDDDAADAEDGGDSPTAAAE